MICSLTIAFFSGWELTLVILLFVPLIVFAGTLQGKKMAQTKKTNEKKDGKASWEEKGGMVTIVGTLTNLISSVFAFSLPPKRSIVSEPWLAFIKKNTSSFIMRIVSIRNFGQFSSFDRETFLRGNSRRAMMKIQIQSVGTGLANSLMFFIHAAAFGFGSYLVENCRMQPLRVFR